MTTPIHNEFSGIASLRLALASGQVSALEIAQSALNAISKSTINAFVDTHHDFSIQQAQAAQANIQQYSLAGIPIAHKDVFVTKGFKSTACSKMLAHYQSPFDATVVHNLQLAGAVSLGKLNCDEFAMGSSNETSAFGVVKNPWDHHAVAGGSSGGSAAAVASGLVMAATGSDTGGSIRQPASFCGVSGIKPTYGTASRYGMIAYASSLDQAGAFARSAEDLVEIIDVMTGFDDKDSTMVEQSQAYNDGKIKREFKQLAQASSSTPLKGLRIGLPKEYFGEGLASDVNAAIQVALKEFQTLGAELIEIELPLTKFALPAYYVIASAEASSNLSRFDGVRYGHRSAHYKDLNELTSRSRAEAFGPEVQRRILMGTYVLSHGYYDAYYVQAQKIRRLVAQDLNRALLQQCDVIMGPVAPTVAWDINSKNNDPVSMYLADIFTLSPSLAGLPTLSIPCGFGQGEVNSKRPVGLQIIGNHFAEAQLLHIAHRFQIATDWHTRKPLSEN